MNMVFFTIQREEKGFTLIELLVSVALFSVVMTISIGTLLALLDANRQAQSLKSVVNNLNFAIDDMTRTLRTGYTFHCDSSGFDWDRGDVTPNDCLSGDSFVGFIDDRGVVVAYRYNSTEHRIERNMDEDGNGVPDGWQWLTAPEVNIIEMLFYVTGALVSDGGLQPRVTISIRGEAGADLPTRSEFNVQTTVTQRLLDI